MPDRYVGLPLIFLVNRSWNKVLTQELAQQVTKSSNPGRVTVSIVNPSFVRMGMCLEALLARTEGEGGRIRVSAAEGGEETHRQYLDDCEVRK